MILLYQLCRLWERVCLRGQSTFDEITDDPDRVAITSQPEQILGTKVNPEYNGCRSHANSYTGEEDRQGEALVDTDRLAIGSMPRTYVSSSKAGPPRSIAT
jgi:hypothetical protein